ncbi:cytochrome c family protein [Psychromarinibacter sp. C21-152]|uniref:Cytochrome c family protein n=1 Tax=Psychromarinibacter sediminicola TaxID=3033385 RepID=A0AAE3T7W6_9RHOB|nr:cytochrome c family protein [Psychromarinibacter sediminicola]MDF0600770.1 cytochrome c family protein [Psychromarinibacter sediminicola]
MFDTMTLTKIVGGFCGMFLIFLLGNWAGEVIYHVGEGGHGDEHHQAFTIETGEGDGTEEEEVVEEVDFATVYAEADASAGESLFRACRSCHRVEEGENATGPHLYGIVGREVDAVEGFNYSGALEEAADVWTPENLSAFLEDPSGYAPGTRMSYNGMDDIEDRADLIAWLDTLDD